MVTAHNSKNRSERLGFIKTFLPRPNIRCLFSSSFTHCACSVLILCASGVQAAEFIPLGSLNVDNFGSGAADVSNDGTVVVGSGVSAVFDPLNEGWGREAFRWTAETGMVGLGDFPGGFFRSSANGVSADGSVVVGMGNYSPSLEAFRWTSANGMVGLGVIEGSRIDSWANGISADGSVVVGTSRAQGPTHREAFRWTSGGGMVGLGVSSPGFDSWGKGVSADGSVVVGWSDDASSFQAFRWTEAGGMVRLGDLLGGNRIGSEALAVSADGNVVVGYGSSDLGLEAFRWTSAGGMVGLGHLPGGAESRAIGATADGNIVVGNDKIGTLTNSRTMVAGNSKTSLLSEVFSEAFVWTQDKGMQRLQDILEANGTTGLDGWSKLFSPVISANGQWLVGSGTNPFGNSEAFLVELPGDLVPGFEINAGLNDAWVNANAAFQGMFVTVFPVLKLMFVAWFTFDSEQPPEDITAVFGAPDQRWVTALGFYDGNRAELKAELTTGGKFNASDPLPTQDTNYGTINIEFSHCNLAWVEFDFPSAGESGLFTMQRVVDDNVALCEALKAE